MCVRDKMCDAVLDMFMARFQMHKNAYQHLKTGVFDAMLVDAFELADDYLSFEGDDARAYSLSESVKDMSAYMQVSP